MHSCTDSKPSRPTAARSWTAGLWRYTRHPGYFGDACVWWGIFVIACGSWASLATVISPLLMTCLLVWGSGKRLTEKQMAASGPGYPEYAARTSGFFFSRHAAGEQVPAWAAFDPSNLFRLNQSIQPRSARYGSGIAQWAIPASAKTASNAASSLASGLLISSGATRTVHCENSRIQLVAPTRGMHQLRGPSAFPAGHIGDDGSASAKEGSGWLRQRSASP